MSRLTRFLFRQRPPPLRHDPQAWWGSTSARLPIGHRGLILVFFGLFFSLGTLLACGQYVRKVDIQGVIAPRNGQLFLISPDNGTLQKMFVHSGDRVHAGDAIAEIAVLRKAGAEGTAGGETVALRHSLDSVRAIQAMHQHDRQQLTFSASDELRQIADEATQARMEFDADVQAEQASASELAKLTLLVNEGIRSSHELAAAQIDHLRLKNESTRARENISRIEGQKTDLQEKTRQQQSDLMRQGAETEARIDELQIELDRALNNESFRIIASHDGVVDSIFRQTGDAVAAGDIVATIGEPDAPVQAMIFIRPSDIGFVRKGDPMILQVDAFPSQQFGSITGMITSVSSTAVVNSQYQRLASLSEGSHSYMAVVGLNATSMAGFGQRWSLRSGMTVHGYVALERQSLFRWLFSPVFIAYSRNPYFLDRLTGKAKL